MDKGIFMNLIAFFPAKGGYWSMQTKECPSCAMGIDEKSKVCPICGYEFTGYSATVRWTAIVLIMAILLSLLFYVFG
jgi:RNA polymerase subunit RPABC4/transcription elongation factor Spt4